MIANHTDSVFDQSDAAVDLTSARLTINSALLHATRQLQSLSPEDLRSLVQIASASMLADTPEESISFLASLSNSLTAVPVLKESMRAPDASLGEPLQIKIEDVLFVPKLSKIEWDLFHCDLSYDALLEKYTQDGLDVERVQLAHNNHKRSVEALMRTFPNSGWLEPVSAGRQAIQEAIAKADLVVIVGGDDHFKSMNQYLDGKFVAIVNSDTAHSEGAASYFDSGSVIPFLDAAASGQFLVEEWHRLSVQVNGVTYPTAISEIAVAEEKFKYGSRGTIKLATGETTFKGSGFLIGTGYGSTGWLKSAGRYLMPQLHPWARTDARAHWVEREPYGEVSYPHITNGALHPGEELTITSGMNHQGTLTIDSIIDIPFPRGTNATIRLADAPLKVLRGGNADSPPVRE